MELLITGWSFFYVLLGHLLGGPTPGHHTFYYGIIYKVLLQSIHIIWRKIYYNCPNLYSEQVISEITIPVHNWETGKWFKCWPSCFSFSTKSARLISLKPAKIKCWNQMSTTNLQYYDGSSMVMNAYHPVWTRTEWMQFVYTVTRIL